MYKFDQLKTLARKYNQTTDESLLWKDIMLVLECTEKQAKKYALTHCNSFSFWMCLFVNDKTVLTYEEFFRKGIECEQITEKGYINDKEKLCKYIGVNFKIKFITDYSEILKPKDLIDDGIYQLRIYTGRDLLGGRKNHFMACINRMGVLFLFDTMNRGQGVLASKEITEKQFEKLMDMN